METLSQVLIVRSQSFFVIIAVINEWMKGWMGMWEMKLTFTVYSMSNILLLPFIFQATSYLKIFYVKIFHQCWLQLSLFWMQYNTGEKCVGLKPWKPELKTFYYLPISNLIDCLLPFNLYAKHCAKIRIPRLSSLPLWWERHTYYWMSWKHIREMSFFFFTHFLHKSRMASGGLKSPWC